MFANWRLRAAPLRSSGIRYRSPGRGHRKESRLGFDEQGSELLKRPFLGYVIWRCPFLHHAPTHAISLARTTPAQNGRSACQNWQGEHSWRRIGGKDMEHFAIIAV